LTIPKPLPEPGAADRSQPATGAAYDVILLADYFTDLIFTGLENVPRLGADTFGRDFQVVPGGGFHSARALHRLGLRTGWICHLGNDLFSRYILEEAQKEGLDTHFFRLHPHQQILVSVSFSFVDDRGFISYADDIHHDSPVPLILEQRPRLVHFGSLEYGPAMLEIVEAARRVGARVCMDCQYTHATLETPGVEAAIRAVDVFCPNASEVRQLCQGKPLEAALDQVAGLARCLVVKLGAEGALARSGGEEIRLPSLPVQCVDTTGAGDCFDAGLIYGLLQGASPETCLRYANICGGLSTLGLGSTSTPTRDEMLRWARQSSPPL
jgi:sugar/nucleoside kinase (ribokinase family)